jgi:hypothetical protein
MSGGRDLECEIRHCPERAGAMRSNQRRICRLVGVGDEGKAAVTLAENDLSNRKKPVSFRPADEAPAKVCEEWVRSLLISQLPQLIGRTP